MPALITLEEWAKRQYGDSAPTLNTLRRWAREARIVPAPQKHGRSYFVTASAQYYDPSKPLQKQSLIARIQHGAASARS